LTKILVTGGLGGIGAYLAERALEAGYKVKILDIENKRTSTRAKSPKLKDAEIVYGNIIDYGDCLKCIWDVDTVCHLAAILHPKTEEVPDLAEKVNVGGTANIVKAIKGAGMNDVKIMIGGGQITEEIMKYTGADAYGKDAMTGVALAKKWLS